MKKVDIGKHGESIAIEHLSQQGLRMIDRNYYTRFGEVDIVAQRGEIYHFIEVKTRLGDTYGTSVGAMTPSKMRNFTRTVQSYLKRHGLKNIEMSIDFIGIDIGVDGTIEIEWIENITM